MGRWLTCEGDVSPPGDDGNRALNVPKLADLAGLRAELAFVAATDNDQSALGTRRKIVLAQCCVQGFGPRVVVQAMTDS
jgi:hypothetical protein